MIAIAGFGNPLLDITVTISNDELLHKYNLNDDDQIVIDEEKMKSLLKDISTFPVEYSPGGCAQNTMRILQWLLNKPHSTFMFGAVGDDKQGKDLKTLVENAGVQTRYIINPTMATGTSVALTKQANRSLVAYIGAAKALTVDDVIQVTKHGKLFDNINLLYMEGFFLPNRKETAMYILNCSKERNIPLALNISAPYICKECPETIKYFAENCDILFGNRKEFEALCNAMAPKEDVQNLAVRLSKTDAAQRSLKYGKIIVITNGSKSVICVHSGGVVEEIDVPKIDRRKLKDTTGAGDAFVAGFLVGLFNDRQPSGCLTWGCWCAGQIIQQIGCRIPKYSADIISVK